jgi:hypothetical protein
MYVVWWCPQESPPGRAADYQSLAGATAVRSASPEPASAASYSTFKDGAGTEEQGGSGATVPGTHVPMPVPFGAWRSLPDRKWGWRFYFLSIRGAGCFRGSSVPVCCAPPPHPPFPMAPLSARRTIWHLVAWMCVFVGALPRAFALVGPRALDGAYARKLCPLPVGLSSRSSSAVCWHDGDPPPLPDGAHGRPTASSSNLHDAEWTHLYLWGA